MLSRWVVDGGGWGVLAFWCSRILFDKSSRACGGYGVRLMDLFLVIVSMLWRWRVVEGGGSVLFFLEIKYISADVPM
jgi:hypothetical protein